MLCLVDFTAGRSKKIKIKVMGERSELYYQVHDNKNFFNISTLL